MFIIIEILTQEDNILRMVSDTIFPTLESAQEYLHKKVQKQINIEARQTYDKLKDKSLVLDYLNTHNSEEMVVKNFIIVPLSDVISLHNEKLF